MEVVGHAVPAANAGRSTAQTARPVLFGPRRCAPCPAHLSFAIPSRARLSRAEHASAARRAQRGQSHVLPPCCAAASAGAGLRQAWGASRGRPRGLPACRAAGGAGGAGPLERRLGAAATSAANFFPLWLVLAAAAALARPALLTGLSKDAVTAGLAACMLAMGTTLTLEDFIAVGRRPGLVALGACLQYTIMPALGWAISRTLRLPTPYAVGLCLVACCPGGVASNVVTFLACADVPLSVCMTTVSTLAAAVMTPALTGLLVGTLVPVDTLGLLTSTLQVVLLPVAAGAGLNRAFPGAVRRAAPFAPLFAVACTVGVCASVLARNAAAVTSAGPRLLGAICALHAGGFGLGYAVSRAVGVPERQARTNSIEVGMQNSALGAVLATLHFADPLTPIPGAISACAHSILGSALAGFWRVRDGRAARTAAAAGGGAGGGGLAGDLASSRAQA